MSHLSFILELRAIALVPEGPHFRSGRFWIHVPSGKRVPIADVTFHCFSARAAAIKSIRKHLAAEIAAA